MSAFLKNILLGKAYLSLEFFNLDQKEKIAYLKVEKKGNELVIAESEAIGDIDGLSPYKSGIPATLIINNDKVILKEVVGIEPNDRKLLHKAFPSLQTDEFHYEIWRYGQISVIALCRKTYIKELIGKLESNFNIAAISLGITGLSSLSSFTLPSEITSSTHRISFDNTEGFISPQIVSDEKYTINGLEIPATYLLGFAGILKLLMPPETTGSLIEIDSNLRENFIQKAFFNKGLKAAIILLLCLLLINFFLFTHYFGKAAEMTETVSTNKASIENIARLKKRILEKQQRVDAFNNSARSASSLVINDLVKDIPSSILLTEIAYHPIEKKVKEGEPIITRDSLVSISGTTLSNAAFTQWLEQASKYKWVGNTTITSFGKDLDNNTIFSVNIILKK